MSETRVRLEWNGTRTRSGARSTERTGAREASARHVLWARCASQTQTPAQVTKPVGSERSRKCKPRGIQRFRVWFWIRAWLELISDQQAAGSKDQDHSKWSTSSPELWLWSSWWPDRCDWVRDTDQTTESCMNYQKDRKGRREPVWKWCGVMWSRVCEDEWADDLESVTVICWMWWTSESESAWDKTSDFSSITM